ncbi:hypothetical protein G7Y79_00047g083560 [Physcia stellaris]|nr:hypothetical protein G7Y79_00047g083560 [Physcia stellaris]
MDPVIAVGLAAGILQFLQAGFKAVSVCQEIYRNGSLAEHRDTEEITKLLTTTAEQLKHPIHGLPAAASGHDKDKEVFGENPKKLESYRDILNIRILSQLDFRAVLHDARFDKLDEMIKTFVVKLNEGRNTYGKLITDQTETIIMHIDQRHDQMNQEEAHQRLRDEFIESLFYPEISSRFEDIAESHDGTCQWFFKSSRIRGATENLGQASLSDPNAASSSEDSSINNSRSSLSLISFEDVRHLAEIRVRPWDNFEEWLRSDGDNPYWLSGKPGSGTLHEWTEKRLEEALKLFLLSKPSTLRVCILIDGLDEYEGDENNLMNIIRLMSQSPGTKVCASSRPEEIFRQGFADCPHVRLQDLNYPDILKATSDRLIPALLKRFSVSTSDSILDDLRWRAKCLIQNLTEKSQGIFLWAELMTKDIVTGARNADTFSELEDRLDRTPDTIDGLYMHMLKRLDKSYVREATTYFHHIMAYDEGSSFDDNFPTLLHFACNEENAWAQIGRRSTAYFLTSDFQETCRNLEIRILSRCAGLVEIDESRLAEVRWLSSRRRGVRINQDEECLSRYLREVKFIHKTARDFVRSNVEYFEDSNCRMSK